MSTSEHFPGSFVRATFRASSPSPWTSTNRSRVGSIYLKIKHIYHLKNNLYCSLNLKIRSHTISIFSRNSERFLVEINLTGIPLKLADKSASSKLFIISEDAKMQSRMAVSGAVLLTDRGKELRLVAFSLWASFWLYEVWAEFEVEGLK